MSHSAADWAEGYASNGFALVTIEPGTKAPKNKGWNEPGGYITAPQAARDHWAAHPLLGMGVVLGPSGLGTFDNDQTDYTRIALAALGLDSDKLLNVGRRLEGNPAKSKAVFRVPEGLNLERRALSWPHPDGPDPQTGRARQVTVFELRGGKVQDALPPTIHPSTGKPYRWPDGAPVSRDDVPELPPELVDLWQNWEALRPKMDAACPWREEETPPQVATAVRAYMSSAARSTSSQNGWDKLRETLREQVPLEAVLADLGAKRVGGNSRRYFCPFHAETDPSFWTFRPEGAAYDLWVCSHGGAPVGRTSSKGYSVGDVVDLYQFEQGLEGPGKATAALATREGLDLPEPFDKNVTQSSRVIAGTPASASPSGASTAVPAANEPPVPLQEANHGLNDAADHTLNEAAFHGLAGEIVRAIEPHTEADPAGVLLTLLAAVAAVIGSTPYWLIGGTAHPLRLWVVLVGTTSKGRKGTSFGAVKGLLEAAVTGFKLLLTTGLSSGEGLIYAVRDKVYKNERVKGKKGEPDTFEEVCIDEGVEDKRLLVREEELGRVLKSMGRDGNTLSAILRQGWDMGPTDTLRVMTKSSPNVATGAHIGIVGHITRDELLRYLEDTETANGFANRFLWVSVKRSKVLPFGGTPDSAKVAELGNRLAAAIAEARGGLNSLSSLSSPTLTWTRDGADAWAKVYPDLSEGAPGLVGAVLSRAEAQVIRLAGLYAVLDGTLEVNADHLRAALAVWEYSETSARTVFGDRYGEPVADAILTALKAAGEMTRLQVTDLLGRHATADRLNRAVDLLVRENRITVTEDRETGGRPATIYKVRK